MKDTPLITEAKMLAGEAHKGQMRKALKSEARMEHLMHFVKTYFCLLE